MAAPFRPARGKTVEIPYRTAVIRADPDFEWGKRHEPFYEFSNGRRFDENTAKQGAYNFIPVNVTLTLRGNRASGAIGHIEPQNQAGIFAFLGGVEGDTSLGSLGFTNVTPALLGGVQATGVVGNPAINAIVNGQAALTGTFGHAVLGVISTTGQTSSAISLTGVSGAGSAGLVNALHANLAGVAGTATLGTITAVVGTQSASVNLHGNAAVGALGVINQGQLQQPVMTLTSAAGVTNPTFTFTLDPAIVAGDTMTFQEQVDGGSWSSLLANVTHTFTSGEIAAGEVDLGLSALTNGTYDARMSVTHGSVTSAWSNVIVFTVSVATAGTPLGALLTITH